MPLVKVNMITGKTPEFKKTLFDCIHQGLIEAFGIAFDDAKAVGALTLAVPTPNLYMLNGMEGCVLWDIRVDDKHKHHGIGQKLFDQAKRVALAEGYKK